MTVNELNGKLNKLINDYADAVNSAYPSKSDKPATEADVHELGMKVFHMVKGMKKEMMAFMKDMKGE